MAPRRLIALTALLCALPAGAQAAAATGGAGPGSASAPPSALRGLVHQIAAAFHKGGGHSGVMVVDATTGQTIFARNAGTRRAPASVEKLYTTATALDRLGPAATLVTRVLGAGTLGADGTFTGDLYLRGGGDPTFGAAAFDRSAYGTGATIESLAAAVAAAGIRRVTGRVLGDEGYFDALRGTAAYGFATSTDIGGPLTALAYDRGLAKDDGSAFQTQPASFAAARLKSALSARGVRVIGGTAAAAAPAGASELARVASPPLSQIVSLTLLPSDNWFAEMLLKGLGARFGSAGSTAAGAAVVTRTLRTVGIHPVVVDGSGLSRADATSPAQLIVFLRSRLATADLQAALPVAGRSGTLATRMLGTAAAGRCRAKTGTLSDASALAGFCRARNGHLFAFAVLENRASVARARAAQDAIAVALAAYSG